MKITNKTVAFLIWSLAFCVAILYLFGYIELPTETGRWSKQEELTFLSCAILFTTISSLVGQLSLYISMLLSDEIEFEFDLLKPFSNYLKSRQELNKQKIKAAEQKERLYMDLFNSKSGEEIDLINKKLESLK